MRKKIVAGNWKMNKTHTEGITLLKYILDQLRHDGLQDTEVIIAPPFIHLSAANEQLKDKENIYLGAQNCFWENSGAFTGEISAEMLKSVGVEYVMVGHSERRQHFHESDRDVTKKVQAVLENGLTPIFCCGESLEVRVEEAHFKFVEKQIKESLFFLKKENVQNVIIAYEPIWAIGTGKTATPEQAQEMHRHIRELIADFFDADTAENTTILYGGSCKPDNAKALFAQPDVDGGLIGGASLKAEDFAAIVRSF